MSAVNFSGLVIRDHPEISCFSERNGHSLPAIHLLHNYNPEAGGKMCIFGSIFEDKRHLHLDPILGDLSFIIDYNFLVLDPCGFNFPESFLGASNSCPDCIIETLCRRRFDFSDPCD